MNIPFPVLLGDVGGTNVRLSVAPAPEAALQALPAQKTGAHAGLAEAAEAALRDIEIKPQSFLVCAAGPVLGRSVALTNAAWRIDGADVATRLDLRQGLLFNDFEAQALSIPILRPEWLRSIGNVAPQAGPRLIHGPGTGLGTAALIQAAGRWRAIASEAGHLDFAPILPDEVRIWPFVDRAHGRLTPETVISGPGLQRLHRARRASAGLDGPDLDGEAIVDLALADRASFEAQTIRMFWRLVARYAGDMALVFMATGGVVLAGGILPRILDLLEPDEFRRSFEDKAPYAALAGTIPVQVLVAHDSVLNGMAAIAAKPDLYAIDYEQRVWCAG